MEAQKNARELANPIPPAPKPRNSPKNKLKTIFEIDTINAL